MIRPVEQAGVPPALRRLAALAPLDSAAVHAILGHIPKASKFRGRRDILQEGSEITGPRLVISGWIARTRIFADGRRQLLSFLLPGDLIGLCSHPDPVAVSTLTAMTDATLCHAPPPNDNPSLAEAYAVSRAIDEAYLLDHIARLGRLNAQERIYSLLLELNYRLELSGLASGGTFTMPLTQEALADALGLTTVHINRMVQLARREGDLQWENGRITLHDPALLAERIGWTPARVTSARPRRPRAWLIDGGSSQPAGPKPAGPTP